MEKIVYVYEGIRKIKGSKRRELINPMYFCGEYKGEGNAVLWDRVYDYIESHYEIDKIKKIYLNSDGGAWIMGGAKRIAGLSVALDEFHLQKYLCKATNHLLDSADDARRELRKCIEENDKCKFKRCIQKALNVAETVAVENRVKDTRDYILNNWDAAHTRVTYPEGIVGSSTEGHVSHVLSDRMSTRAMGWCHLGADKMAHLRAYNLNDGNMLKLALYQKSIRLKKAAGAEEKAEDNNDILSCAELLEFENRMKEKVRGYGSGVIHGHVSTQSKKKYYFNNLIWGL